MIETEPIAPPRAAGSGWTLAGLAVALFTMPLVVGAFTLFRIEWTPLNIAVRELLIFACAGLLACIIRRGERLGWESVGLQRASLKQTALWILIAMVCVAAALAVAVVLARLLNLPLGGPDAAKFSRLPVWVLVLVIARAGFGEEFFYRGYAIDRIQRLMGSRAWAVALPLVLFALFHYRQGWAGILIALFTGAVLTWTYVYKRNLWIGIVTHFLVDLIPNVIVPLFRQGE